MADSDAPGAQGRLCVEPGAAPHTFDSNSEPYDPLYESIQKQGRIVGGHQIRGTRSQSQERTRFGAFPVGGNLALNPSAADLDNWLPRILGAAAAGTTFSLAETLPSFGVLVDRVNVKHQYTDCMVDHCLIRGTAGPGDGDPDLIEMVLGLVGKTEVLQDTFPTLFFGTTEAYRPYVMSDASTVTLAGAARQVKRFALLIRNFIYRRWSMGSLTATRLSPQDRLITLDMTVPYDTAHTDLYDQALAGAQGIIQFTNGNLSTNLTFGTLQVPSDSPFIKGKTEIDLTLSMVARKTGTTPELVVVNTSTP